MPGFKIAEAFVEVTTRDNTSDGESRIRARLSGMRASIQIDADTKATEAKIRAVEAQLADLRRRPTSLKVEAEIAAAEAKLVALKAKLDTLRDKSVKVDVDTGRGISALTNLNLSSQRSTAILLAVAGAAGIAGGAIAALPAFAASFGGVASVLVGSFHGIGDALKGYSADQEAAAQTSTKSAATELSNARQIRDAQQSIDDARRNQARVAEQTSDAIATAKENEARVIRDGDESIAAAEQRVNDALDKERAAQEALTAARADAQRQIESLIEKVHDLALDQEGAAIAVEEAQGRLTKTLADSTATDLDKRKAQYELAVAQERVRDLTRESTEANTELDDANRKGIDGSDQVVAAQGKVADAHQDVLSAQHDLTVVQRNAAEAQQEAAKRVTKAVEDGAQAQEDANMAVARALQGLKDAQDSQAASAEAAAVKTSKFADAMAKLNPQQRALVTQLLAMRPLVDGLSATSSKAFLPGLTQVLKDSEGLFPIFNAGLERTGTIMGDTSRKAGEMFKSQDFKNNLDGLFRATDPITRSLGDGFVNLSGRLVKFGSDMAPAAQGFSDFLDKTISGLSGFMDKLSPHADSFKRIFDALGRIMDVLLPVLGDVVGELADHLAPALESVAGWMERNHDKVDDLIFILGGLFLTLKAAKIVSDVSTWATGVMGFLDRIGTSAETNKGKVSGLAGTLKTVGVLAGAYVAGQGLKAIGDPSKGGIGGASLGTQARDAADTAGDVLTLNVGGVFDKLKRDIESFPTDLERAGGRIDGAMRHIFGDGLNDAANNFSGWLDRMFGVSDGRFGDIEGSTTSHMGRVVDVSDRSGGSTFGNLQRWFSGLGNDANTWFSNMRDRAGDRLTNLRDSAGQLASNTWSNISGWFGRLGNDAGNWFADMRNRAWGWLDNLRGSAIDLAIRIRDGVTNAFNVMADWATGAWGRLRDAANAPIRWVIDVVYNQGVVPLWNKVVDVFGGPRAVPLAGGGVIPGFAPGRDIVPAMLSPGEGVLTPEAVRAIGPHNVLALNRAASGRRPGATPGGVAHFAAGGIVGDIASAFADPVGTIKRLFAGIVGDGNRTPGSGLFRNALASLPGKVIDLAIEKVKGLISSVGSAFSAAFTGSGNVMAWIQAALGLTGTPQSWAGPLSVLIQRESGGNPNAINLWDSNAKAGHPSQGLMQTIPSTFNAYHQPGTSWNILDPVANIAAGINYIKARYGSIFNVQQANPNLSPRGYDAGGVLPPGMSLAHNRTGRPERVLSADQTAAFERLVDAITGTGRGGQNLTVNVTQTSGSPAETGRFVALALRTVG